MKLLSPRSLPLSLALAFAPALQATPAEPPTDREASCGQHITERAAMPAEPKGGWGLGWTVIAYELDGSGKALNLRVHSSSGNRALDRGLRLQLERSVFAAGVVKAECRDLVTVKRERM